MLKRVTPSCASPAQVRIGDASFPAPFSAGLEFNPPVHGAWNIVHIGMLVPESHQIYVCAQNCMRGVVLTAAEMNAQDRFSCVLLEEQDLLDNSVEEATISGVAEVLEKLPKLPPVVLLFTVCVHHFLGCDLTYIYHQLSEQFPSVRFVRCYMDPILQKQGLTPDQKLRKSMLDPLPACAPDPKAVSLLGNLFAMGQDSDLALYLEQNHIILQQIQSCTDYTSFLTLSKGYCFLTTAPNARYGVSQAAKRLDRPFLYLPASFHYDEILGHLGQLSESLQLPRPDSEELIAKAEAALEETKRSIGSTPIAIDISAHPRPLGLARLLLAHGFRVERVWLDCVNPEEKADFLWLQEHHPGLTLCAIIHPLRRVLPRNSDEQVLAIGQKAAWFENTAHFVNIVEGGDLWGFAGIVGLCRLMREAFETEKDTRDIVPRKGLGCESCYEPF